MYESSMLESYYVKRAKGALPYERISSRTGKG
ncbi:hypothetical protein HBHAL_3092 [Halobacillus halophilus DSM 2266]|uniref:Uncharacterized protein n=1 Tax=Halobacillus halophilus (strain ATCC 35676 / DSM 2266 / JCM 20832 / KCTC 3685 / LMG 17431 / NBRC 102448 / NCIMB 2269) TaxID=866895 RepID=I0JMR9_HALH3|nr:hypothetical protein HBHAL_3092 [Halobacillus halophilus DSM 2266]